MAGRSGTWFLLLAIVASLLLAFAGNLVVVRILDRDVNWIVTGATSVAAGIFVALLVLGRRQHHVAGKGGGAGFDVTVQRRK